MKQVKISVIIILCMIFIFVLCGCSIMKTDMDTYSKMAANDSVMPAVEDLGEYESVQFKYYFHDMCIIFHSESYIVVAEYSDNFAEKKVLVESEYTFQEGIIELEYSDVKLKPSFTLDGFDFRVLSESYSYLGFPKDMYFIGINEEEKKIAYIRYHNFDLDRIDSFEEFIVKDCGWDYSL